MDKISCISSVDSTTSKKLIKDSFGAGNWHLNACVGSNTGSHDNSVGYSGGFQAAAEVMLRLLGVARPSQAGENWGEYPLIDMLVYPICYCARHHIELVLKRSLPKAWRIFKIRFPHESKSLSEPKQVELTHSVLSVWSTLDEICAKADPRLGELTTRLKPYVTEIDEIDGSGQTFRYASNAEGSQPHLSELSHINLQFFAEGYAELCEILEKLEFNLEAIAFEVATGVYTSKLNRDQLLEVAKLLPPRDQWRSSAFLDAKQKIIDEYHLSSNDFQKACKLIQKTRTLAHHIGISIPISGLSRDTFMRLRNAPKWDNMDLTSLNSEECSIVFALLQVGSPTTLPEQFESFLKPRPENEDEAHQFDIERVPAYLARRASSRPDLLERALTRLGQEKLLSDFRDIFKEEIEALKAARERDKEIDFAELFHKIAPNLRR